MNFLRSRRRKHSATSAAAAAAADDVTADSPVHVARDVTKSSASRVLTIDVYPSNHKHVVKVLPGLLLGMYVTVQQSMAACNQSLNDNKPSLRVLPPGHWGLKLKICRLFHANKLCASSMPK